MSAFLIEFLTNLTVKGQNKTQNIDQMGKVSPLTSRGLAGIYH